MTLFQKFCLLKIFEDENGALQYTLPTKKNSITHISMFQEERVLPS